MDKKNRTVKIVESDGRKEEIKKIPTDKLGRMKSLLVNASRGKSRSKSGDKNKNKNKEDK